MNDKGVRTEQELYLHTYLVIWVCITIENLPRLDPKKSPIVSETKREGLEHCEQCQNNFLLEPARHNEKWRGKA